jgi:hypothetical protein
VKLIVMNFVLINQVDTGTTSIGYGVDQATVRGAGVRPKAFLMA